MNVFIITLIGPLEAPGIRQDILCRNWHDPSKLAVFTDPVTAARHLDAFRSHFPHRTYELQAASL